MATDNYYFLPIFIQLMFLKKTLLFKILQIHLTQATYRKTIYNRAK